MDHEELERELKKLSDGADANRVSAARFRDRGLEVSRP